MQVSGASNNILWTVGPSANTSSQKSAVTNSLTGNQGDLQPKSGSGNTIDFTNMSRREFDELFKAGVIDMDIPPRILPLEGLDISKSIKEQMNAVYDKKINYIEYFEGRIEYQKSLPVTQDQQKMFGHYKESLNALLSLQGEQRNPSVDVTA